MLFSVVVDVGVLEPRHAGARGGPHPHRHERKLSQPRHPESTLQNNYIKVDIVII